MLNGEFSRYYNTDSFIHSMNPLCKILALLIFVFMVLIGSNIRVMCGLGIVLLFLISISNVPFINYFRPIFSMKILFIFIFVINFLFGVSFYSSIIMISKVILIVSYSAILLFTTTTNEVALGFSSLLRPFIIFRFPVYKFSMAIALALNFIPCLFEQSNKIIKSQASRGFNYNSGSFKDKIIGIKSIIIPMFVLSIRRADSISDAMEVKNFSFDFERSSVNGIRWHLADIYMLSCHLIILSFVLIKEVVV